MLSSMFSGVSGLRSHQTMMDVIGNNIANVNTTAFKSSNVTFAEVYSQSIESARAPSTDGTGGSNPQQIGLGVTVGDIAVVHKNGSIQRTDNPNDMAIDGEGFFVVSDGQMLKYTRAGNFNIDSEGNLVTASGAKVQGWNIDEANAVDTSRPVEPINFANLSMPAQATTTIDISGNINSTTLEYDSVNDENAVLLNVTIYDSLGEDHTLTFKMMKTANDNEYDYELLENDDDMDITAEATGGTITFDMNGELSTTTLPVTPAITISFTNGADDVDIADGDLVFNETSLTQYANATQLTANQDGYTSGSLENLTIDREGNATGIFANGRQQHVATIAIASFINVAGLEKAGNNQFISTWNSGEPNIGTAGSGDRGLISTGALEMSNVDLAEEFTQMIVAQRGFQANSRIITTADELLQELVNLKR